MTPGHFILSHVCSSEHSNFAICLSVHHFKNTLSTKNMLERFILFNYMYYADISLSMNESRHECDKINSARC